MEIRYLLADPTGNMTALVEGFSPGLSPGEAAAAVFGREPAAEQLGFLSESETADISLQMAGGEFCGNACLSAAAYQLRREGYEEKTVLVSISGAEKPLAVDMKHLGGNEYSGSVEMPLPLEIGSTGGKPLVRFPGISHVIMPPSTSPEEAEALIRPLCTMLRAEALGLMLFDEANGSLRPLVYVPGADTLCWERSCASGSCAVGAWLSIREGKALSLELHQPGGTLRVDALCSGGTGRIVLGGCVRLGDTKCLNVEKNI